MAIRYDFEQLRHQLQGNTRELEDPFGILQSLSVVINTYQEENVGRDLLLRALDRRDHFGEYSPILDSMARTTGLFPYADPGSLSASEAIAYEFHKPEEIEGIVFHREQAEIYRRLMAGDSVILSAPTSFGKSRVVDAIVASGKHRNIAVIVPTLALIDETRKRLAQFSDKYKVVTHLGQKPADRNIFILTAERAVSISELPRIDFFVIDEFYKIGALEEDESRTVALNEAFYRLRKDGGQFYLLGPNIQQIPDGLETQFKCFFYRTRFSTVAIDTVRIDGEGKDINRILPVLREMSEPTLVYCSSPAKVNEIARAMLEEGIVCESPSLTMAADWIAKHYHKEWIFGAGLVNGIGIHHGKLPRSLAQYIVRAFNEEKIRYLICTSTLIEGVNTKAKNVLIWDNTIGNNRPLDFFTFNNIRGRSGRMFQHFVGKVFLFNDPPQERLPFVDFPLFTQEDTTPDSLLIQLDQGDLKPSSQDRVKKYSDQTSLSLEVLKSNHSIDPEKQLILAKRIDADSTAIWNKLAWKAYPTYEELKFACELLWDTLVDSNKKYGVTSGSQLAFKTMQLMQTKSTARRVVAELRPGKFAAKSPDEAVERVLQFERSWAGFEIPKLFRALSSIQQDVLSKRNLPFGDYSLFAAHSESLFRPAVVANLDEYGVPVELGEKLIRYLQTRDDLDTAIEALKQLKLEELDLHDFEKELISIAQDGL